MAPPLLDQQGHRGQNILPRDTMARGSTPFIEPPLRTRMTRDEILLRLRTIKDKGNKALQLLDSTPLSPVEQAEIQSLARWLKEELQTEYRRMLPERVQKTMTMFELSVYSPT